MRCVFATLNKEKALSKIKYNLATHSRGIWRTFVASITIIKY